MKDRTPLSEQTSLNLLGWHFIQQKLARLAESPVTQSRCATLVPATDFATARRLLDETAEMVSLIEAGESFPMRMFHDLSPLLQQAEDRHLIEPEAFLTLLNILHLVRDIKRFLQKQDRAPRLRSTGETLEPLTGLSKEITRCIHPDGDVHESASPELKQAVQEVTKVRNKLHTAVRKILGSATLKEGAPATICRKFSSLCSTSSARRPSLAPRHTTRMSGSCLSSQSRRRSPPAEPEPLSDDPQQTGPQITARSACERDRSVLWEHRITLRRLRLLRDIRTHRSCLRDTLAACCGGCIGAGPGATIFVLDLFRLGYLSLSV